MMRDVHWCVTVFYQQIENGNIANQIHGFTIDYRKFILNQTIRPAEYPNLQCFPVCHFLDIISTPKCSTWYVNAMSTTWGLLSQLVFNIQVCQGSWWAYLPEHGMQNEPSYQPDYVWMSHLYQDSDNLVDIVHSVGGVAQKSIKNIIWLSVLSLVTVQLVGNNCFLHLNWHVPLQKHRHARGARVIFRWKQVPGGSE